MASAKSPSICVSAAGAARIRAGSRLDLQREHTAVFERGNDPGEEQILAIVYARRDAQRPPYDGGSPAPAIVERQPRLFDSVAVRPKGSPARAARRSVPMVNR